MAILRNFRDLNACQASRSEAQRIVQLSKAFPHEERYSPTDQTNAALIQT